MSRYQELVERLAKEILNDGVWADDGWDMSSEQDKRLARETAGAILAEVLRTLENVTPDMAQAAFGPGYMPGEVGAASAKADFLAMLRASPLVRP